MESGLVCLLTSLREIGAFEVQVQILGELLSCKTFQAYDFISVIAMLAMHEPGYVVLMKSVIGAGTTTG